MNFREKYNRMIDLVEQNAESKTSEIGEAISRDLAVSPRTAYDIFKFLSDFTFAEYVGIRRLQWVFDYKKEYACSWADATAHYGEDYSSYFRRFKAKFGVSPSDALNEENAVPFLPPLYLEELLKKIDAGQMQEKTAERKNQMFHSPQITYEQFEVFDTMQNYKALYDFENKEIVEAYNLSQKYDIPLDELCECRAHEKFLEEDELDSSFSEEAISKAAELVKKYDYSFLSVYSFVAAGYSEEFIRMIMDFGLSDEDGDLFVASMEEDRVGWDEVTPDTIKLYYAILDLCAHGGCEFSVGTCIEILDAADKLDVNIFEDLDTLDLLASNYEGSCYELVSDYKDLIYSDPNDISCELKGSFPLDFRTEVDLILDEMARKRGDDF